jgi:hypothetical protein
VYPRRIGYCVYITPPMDTVLNQITPKSSFITPFPTCNLKNLALFRFCVESFERDTILYCHNGDLNAVSAVHGNVEWKVN